MRVVSLTAVRLLVVVALLCLAIPVGSKSAESLWKPFAGGVEGIRVDAMIQFNGDLIIGGQFTKAGGVEVHNAARWDGNQWHPMGSGTWNTITQFAKTSTTLYARGGDFYGETLLAYWNGTDWIPVPDWQYSPIDAMTVWNDKLVLGGVFFQPGNPMYAGLTFWNGSSWSYPDTTQIQVNFAARLATLGNTLIVGPSNYLPPFGQPAGYRRLVQFDGATWVAMENGLPPNTSIGEIGLYNGKLLGLNDAYSAIHPVQAYEWQDSVWTPTTEPAFISPDSNALPQHSLQGQMLGQYYFSWYANLTFPSVPVVWDGNRWVDDIPGAYCYADYDGNILAGLTATATDHSVLGYRASLDADADGVFDLTDNCSTTPNDDQSDIDRDGIGDICDPCFACEQTVYISSIEGSRGNDTILARTPLRFYFSLSTLPDSALQWILMGYKMYSPDGASWQSTTYDSLALGWKSSFKNFFFSNEPLGTSAVDTFGIAAINISSSLPGFPSSYQAAYSVLSTSFAGSEAGKTICIDTSRFIANRPIQPPALYPIYFADKQMTIVYPRWIGPRCFTIWDCGNKTSGNIDCDPTDRVDIADLTNLIDHLYLSGAPLCCPIEANVDGDQGVDLGDVSRLIDHLYISFQALAPLP